MIVGRIYWMASEPDPRDVLGVGKRRPTKRTFWQVKVQWRTAGDHPVWGSSADPVWVAVCCGHIAFEYGPDALDTTVGDELHCGACGARWSECRPAGHVQVAGGPRNVLVERVLPDTSFGKGLTVWFETGEVMVRPFRGLRRWREDG